MDRIAHRLDARCGRGRRARSGSARVTRARRARTGAAGGSARERGAAASRRSSGGDPRAPGSRMSEPPRFFAHGNHGGIPAGSATRSRQGEAQRRRRPRPLPSTARSAASASAEQPAHARARRRRPARARAAARCRCSRAAVAAIPPCEVAASCSGVCVVAGQRGPHARGSRDAASASRQRPHLVRGAREPVQAQRGGRAAPGEVERPRHPRARMTSLASARCALACARFARGRRPS